MTDFSERFGHREPRTVLQLSNMDGRLRNRVWTEICAVTFDHFEQHVSSTDFGKAVSRAIQSDFFGLPSDEVDVYSNDFRKHIKTMYMGMPWFDIYGFIEFLCASNIVCTTRISGLNVTISPANLLSRITPVLEQEKSGYRFLGKRLIKISDKVELEEISKASNAGGAYYSVGIHIRQAAENYSNREAPDYRNSIKDSISAVEFAAKVLTDDPKVTLGVALGKLETIKRLHPALKAGWSSLYGWTSQEGGIRHAMMEKSDLDEDDARYMLVSCSAFANYLISKATK